MPRAEAAGHLAALFGALHKIDTIHLYAGAFERSWAYSARMLDLAERLGDQLQLVFALGHRGEVLFLQGEWHAARRDLECAVDLGRVWNSPSTPRSPLNIIESANDYQLVVTDGGQTWAASQVAGGTGSFGSVGRFNDKEYITAWGNGNAIVTWTQFNQGPHGAYLSSPIYDSMIHDGGKTWSPRQEVGGAAPFCIGAQGGNACDQDQASIPTVAADGSISVARLVGAVLRAG